MKRASLLFGVCAALFIAAERAQAGPIIIDWTDANSHGFFSSGANQAGWEYMQRALENLAGGVTNGNTRLVVLGANSSTALSAITSAFNNSSLFGTWTLTHITGATNIGTYLDGGTVSGANLANTGILHLTTVGETSGDMTAAELAAINFGTRPTAISNFVGAGGGFWSMTETGAGAYGWLTTLIPGITFSIGGASTDITLTAAGSTAFPGLTNADLAGADPWHTYFSGNFGGLQVLGTALLGNQQRAVILGGGGGTTFEATVPEPSTFAIFGIFLAVGAGCWFYRRQRATAASVA